MAVNTLTYKKRKGGFCKSFGFIGGLQVTLSGASGQFVFLAENTQFKPYQEALVDHRKLYPSHKTWKNA